MAVLRTKVMVGFVLLFLVMSGCTGDVVFDQHIDFPDQSWQLDEPYQFPFSIEDASEPYQIRLFLRNTVDYPLQNLYLQWSLRDSLGNDLRTDLVNIPLFEEKTGRPINKGLSDIATQEVLLDSLFVFPFEGQYEFTVEQYMRENILTGLLGVGLQIKAKNE
jgi:gliding motility-associated lipoprotein GldH